MKNDLLLVRKSLKWISVIFVSFYCFNSLTAFEHDDDGGAIDVEVLAKGGASWDGTTLPHYPTGTPEITLLRITIPPHTALPLHKHPVINAGILLEGELSVVSLKGERKQLKTGEPLIELVEQWHFGKNESEKPAVILVFYAGEKDKPITIKHPDPESVLESSPRP